jgi:hypothetical protein
MRIEDLTAKIWRHFAENAMSHRNPTRGIGAELGFALAAVSSFGLIVRSRRSQWYPRSSPSLELIDNRVSKLRVRYDQAFLPSTTPSVATTASSSEGCLSAIAGSATASARRVGILVGTVVRT